MSEFFAALGNPDILFLRYAFVAGILSSVAFGIVGTYGQRCAAFGDFDGLDRHRARLGAKQQHGRADHEHQQCSHGQLRSHGMTSSPGNCSEELSIRGHATMSGIGCRQNALFQIFARLLQWKHAYAHHRPHLRLQRRTANAGIGVALRPRLQAKLAASRTPRIAK